MTGLIIIAGIVFFLRFSSLDRPIDVEDGSALYIPMEGLIVEEKTSNTDLGDIDIFTTRADTIYGVSYIGISLSHPFVSKLDIEIQNFCKSKDNFLKNESITKNSINGVFSGFYAYHPITKEKIPIWCCNYILMDYGTGAIMGVPAHDERDYLFAK